MTITKEQIVRLRELSKLNTYEDNEIWYCLELLPALLDEVERLQGESEQLKEQVRNLETGVTLYRAAYDERMDHLDIAVEALEAIAKMNHRDQGARHGNVVSTIILLGTALSMARVALAKINGDRK